MNFPDGVPNTATVLRPTPFFWDTRDATVLRVAAIISQQNSREYGHFVNRLNDWAINDARYKAIGIVGPVQPLAPEYEVLIAVWVDTNGNVKAVATSIPGADPSLGALVGPMPSIPVDYTIYMWSISVNGQLLKSGGIKTMLPTALRSISAPIVSTGVN